MSHSSSYLCDQHATQVDQSSFITFHDGANIDVQGNLVVVVDPAQTGSVTLQVTQSVSADVTIICAQKADVTIRLIILLAEQVHLNVSVIMCQDYSNVKILGMCMLADTNKAVISTKQVHCGRYCHSRLVLQGLLNDHARLEYDGMIRIEPQACGTYALQNNKNILLSGTSSAVSIPNIEVLHHDVQCYHGSAIGKFDLEQMRYMQSRGLNEAMMKQLLVQALFADVLENYEKKIVILQTVYEKL